MTKKICVFPVAAPTLCTADKVKGQSKSPPCSGEGVEAESDGSKMIPWLHLNLTASW